MYSRTLQFTVVAGPGPLCTPLLLRPVMCRRALRCARVGLGRRIAERGSRYEPVALQHNSAAQHHRSDGRRMPQMQRERPYNFAIAAIRVDQRGGFYSKTIFSYVDPGHRMSDLLVLVIKYALVFRICGGGWVHPI